MKPNYPYELPALPFAYDALEPVISKLTLEFHHDKHFLAYINNLNDAISKDESLQSKINKSVITMRQNYYNYVIEGCILRLLCI